jgi:succinoglycan biosynthesis protein ExoL
VSPAAQRLATEGAVDLGAVVGTGRGGVISKPDVVIARNLETLALAGAAGSIFGRDIPVVYECLDIHRLLLGTSAPARLLQAIEARMLARVDLVLTSSPAFERDYFRHRPTLRAPVMLLENKLLVLDGEAPKPSDPAAGPPWVIAWFGMLRCARTFDILAALATKHEGRIQVHIAGRPSPAVRHRHPRCGRRG